MLVRRCQTVTRRFPASQRSVNEVAKSKLPAGMITGFSDAAPSGAEVLPLSSDASRQRSTKFPEARDREQRQRAGLYGQ